MAPAHRLYLRLSLPYTVVPEGDRVHLIAGEDARTTLKGPELSAWLPPLLERLPTGTLDEAIDSVPERYRPSAQHLVERLFGERVLVEAVPLEAVPVHRLVVQGSGEICDRLQGRPQDTSEGDDLYVLCQDRLDYDAVLRFQQVRREHGQPWIWATYGPMARGFVSPIFLPHAGPCFRCLLAGFIRLSPVPEIYDQLLTHTRAGGEVRPVPFPASATTILAELVTWKAALFSASPPRDAVFRLHVLETESLEVTSHRILLDAECPVCGSSPEGGR